MDVDESSVNSVVLRGRVSSHPQERELFSGDRLVSVRLVVPRPSPRRPRADRRRVPTVDTFECVGWTVRAGKALKTLSPDDQVIVSGSLRRHFWRAGGAVASRVEVEVGSVRRVRGSAASAVSAGRQRRQASDA